MFPEDILGLRVDKKLFLEYCFCRIDYLLKNQDKNRSLKSPKEKKEKCLLT